MRNFRSLSRRINRLREQVEQRRAKTWYLVLEVGEPVPDAVQKLVGPDDKIVIHEIPVGYFGEHYEQTRHLEETSY